MSTRVNVPVACSGNIIVWCGVRVISDQCLCFRFLQRLVLVIRLLRGFERRHFGVERFDQLMVFVRHQLSQDFMRFKASGSLPRFERTPVATVCCRFCGAMFEFLGSLFGCSLQLLSGVSCIASALYLMLFFSYFICSPYWGLTPCPSGAWFVCLPVVVQVSQLIQLVVVLTQLEVPQEVVRVSQ
ncbi:hypothetical protein F511_31888 [Dorcoceras hygrometricum]|uniref:Uncharacterized protein n=1 Tax=Dorcoceras hygrometricum TaxID=472368 RepID=A0A2Z7D5F9_9LAMI|nr:hypothetical protein F511_31888 [Dorcoceras hygrometricum]